MASYTIEHTLSQIKKWQLEGQKIVFTNGVFDILHVGHVDYLERAKALGDKLVVGVNDDASVRRLGKSPERPINAEAARARVIGALRSVDAVVIFQEDTPLAAIRQIEPQILVKGGDYSAEVNDPADKRYIVGSKEVRELGGKVEALSLVQGFSTTNTISKLGLKKD